MNNAEWRGYDIGTRQEKIRSCYAGKPLACAEDMPVLVHTPNYFAFGGKPRSAKYWSDPKVMYDFQAAGYEHHLAHVDDDVVPYFMPWFGTGVLASAFGCDMREPEKQGEDPAIAGPCVQNVQDIAKLKLPDPYQDKWMSRVLQFMDYAREKGDLPVGPTDLNSPLSTMAQICGYENLFLWMYEEPSAVHELMEMVCETFTRWLKVQKKHSGEPLDASHGLQGVWSPKGVGVWMSDDDLVSISASLYEEFVVEHYSKIFTTFGGGSLHYCGKGNHHLENFKKIKGLRAINNSPMGDFVTLAKLVKNRPKGVVIQIQDNVPLDAETYYGELFSSIESLDGVMVATWSVDKIAMEANGGYTTVEWDATETANKTVCAIRSAVRSRLMDG